MTNFLQGYTGPGDFFPTWAAYGLLAISSAKANAAQAVNLVRSSDSAAKDFGFTRGSLNQADITAWGGVAATGTGSISGTTLTFTGGVIGGEVIGAAPGTLIVSGADPTWTVNISQTLASTTLTVNNALKVATLYDQSGNGHDAIQATDANRPFLSLYAINNRPALYFGAGSSRVLSDATGVTGQLWAAGSGGYALCAASKIGVSAATGTVFLWPGSLGAGAPKIMADASDHVQVVQKSNTVNGAWITTTSYPTGNHLVGLVYNNSALANVPVVTIDGAAVTFTTNTQPTGTISNPSGVGPQLGGSNSGGSLGFPGFISAWVFAALPSSAARASARQCLGQYYGIATT